MNPLKALTFASAAAAFLMLAATMFGGTKAEEPKATASAPQSPRFYVVLYQAGPAWKAGLPMAEQDLRPHGLYYKELLSQGRVVGGGRFEALDGGMAILRAASLEEAQGILAADPAVTSGVFTADLRVWTPRFFDEALAAPVN